MKYIALMLTFLAVGSTVVAKYLPSPTHDAHDRKVYDKYLDLDRNIKKMVGVAVKMAIPYMMDANRHLNLTSSCTRDLFQLVSGIKQLKLSAFRFLDAIGKAPAGVFTGNSHMIGDYDECMTTSVLRKEGNVAYKGQYCLILMKPILPIRKGKMTFDTGLEEMIEYTRNTSEVMRYAVSMLKVFYDYPFKFGLCVPSGCSFDDVVLMFNYFGEKFDFNATVDSCEQQNEPRFDTGIIIAIVAFSLVGSLALIGSLMDFYSRKKEFTYQSKCASFFLCFSILINFPKVISTKTSDKSMSSLHGVRALSMFYIILLHHYFFEGTIGITGHMANVLEDLQRFFMQIIVNGFLTTEVFFFLSGLLNTYSRMKIFESTRRNPSVIQMIIHRLLRLYPPVIFSILASFIFSLGKSPLGNHLKKQYVENCRSYWWQNMLFINNFFVARHTCLVHSWYMAADMQLFLISLFTVPVLLRNAKRGIFLHLIILLLGLIGTALWAFHKDVLPSFIYYILDQDAMFKVQNAYITTLPHIAPYFTGLLVGYILSKYKDFKIPKIWQFVGWSLATVSFISMLFMTTVWNSGKEFTPVESYLYFTFSKLVYALAIAWMVVCCVRGYGGIINYILSLKIWVPLARISYMVYLVSPVLQLYYLGHTRMMVDYDTTDLIWRYMGDLGIVHLCGLAMVVVIESPVVSMEKLLFHRKPIKENGSCQNDVKAKDMNTTDENFSRNIELENNIKNDIRRM